MKRLGHLLVCLLLMLSGGGVPAAETYPDSSVVLVASPGFPPGTLGILELRRLFLGLPVYRGREELTPLINASDKVLYQAFLQKVMFMSEANYQRQLVMRVFRRGGKRPEVFRDPRKLARALRMAPLNITFMTREQVKQLKNVEVVQPLW